MLEHDQSRMRETLGATREASDPALPAPSVQRRASADHHPAAAEPSDASASFADAINAGVQLDPFSRRLDHRLASGGGMALPGDLASQAGASFGTSMNNVRVHADAEAGALADEQGFQAFSYGPDVFFKPDAYRPDTDAGRFVMMHELGHVVQTGGDRQAGVQGKVAVGDSSESAEVDADRAADAALAGRPYSVQRAALKVRGFGATNRDGNRTDIVHQNQTENSARRAHFSDRDGTMIYSGNWQMDMNQFLIPAMRRGSPIIFSAMDLMHTLHFGYPIGGSPEAAAAGPGRAPAAANGGASAAVAEFGGYDPAAHIDNPGGLTGHDVNAEHGNAAASHDAGSASDSYAHSESRYQEQYDRVVRAGHTIQNAAAETDARGRTDVAFHVDESGIPIYMQTSRNQLKQRLHDGVQQAALGGAHRDRGLRYAGEALHIMQDYYAHSNFCEVAINILLDSRFNTRGHVAPGGGGTRSLADVLELSRLNPALAGQVPHHLNSYVHQRGAGGVDADRNMSVGPRGHQREVMATGTFTREDTAHSIREKAALAMSGLNPFEASKHGPSDNVRRLITWFEANPAYFPLNAATAGQRVGTSLRSVMPAIDVMMSGAGHVLEARGVVNAAMERGAGAVSRLWHGALGETDAAAAATASHEQRASSSEASATHQQERIAEFRTELHHVADNLARGGSLREMYEFTYAVGSTVTLERMARLIPVVGDRVADVVRREVAEAKEWLRSQFEAAWLAAVQQFTAELNAAVALALGSSEVGDSTGARGMTQPTHTDIAKDFDAHQHGTEDRHSIIEEIGEVVHRAGSAAGAGRNLLGIVTGGVQHVLAGQTGVVDGVRAVGQQLTGQVAANPGAAEHGHDHEHRHGGAWLAPLANVMAHRSSEAILTAFRAALVAVPAAHVAAADTVTSRAGDTGTPRADHEASGIDGVVDRWFAHPEDCKPLWQDTFMDALQGQLQGAGAGLGVDQAAVDSIRAELARRFAEPPSHQAPNEEATIGNRGGRDDHHDHGDHDHGDDHDHRPAPR